MERTQDLVATSVQVSQESTPDGKIKASLAGAVSLKWAKMLAEEAAVSSCLTVGLAAGSRIPNERRAMEPLVESLALELRQGTAGGRTLLIRLDSSLDERMTSGTPGAAMRIPVAQRSLIGPWFEVNLAVSAKGNLGSVVQRMPEWLPIWKESFRLIVLDLGPLHWALSRYLGRLCDGCYLLLGPNSCGSQEWIMQQVAWHNQKGSIICGTLVAKHQAAA